MDVCELVPPTVGHVSAEGWAKVVNEATKHITQRIHAHESCLCVPNLYIRSLFAHFGHKHAASLQKTKVMECVIISSQNCNVELSTQDRKYITSTAAADGQQLQPRLATPAIQAQVQHR